MIPGPLSRPANTLGVIKVIVLVAISVELTGEDQVGDFTAAGGRKRVVAFDTVDVAVEDTGVAGLAEKNQAIGEGFKPGFYTDFEGLVRLGVVVPDRLVEAWEHWGSKGNEHH